MASFKILFTLLSCVLLCAQAKDYSGYKMIQVQLTTEREQQILTDLSTSTPLFDVVPKIGSHSNILLSPAEYEEITMFLKQQGFTFEETISDVGELIRSEKVHKGSRNGKINWDEYYDLQGIYEYMESQKLLHPTLVTLQEIGKTYENRSLMMMKISKNPVPNKPAVWIDANLHAREWITSAVCTHIIEQLLNGPDTGMTALLDDFDFYILPIANPDGFEYSHNVDRFWRKTRSQTSSPLGCMGVDPNRNFDAFWMEGGGASSNPCSLTYAGSAPFSEVETRAMSTFLKTIETNLVFYLSLHSSGQYILIPTGLNNAPIVNFDRYMEIGKKAAQAHLSVHGKTFTPGNIVELMYVATGSSMDWAFTKLLAPNAKLHYTYELRDKGQYGHLLPADQILPSCEEFIEGFKVIMQEIKMIP